MKNYLDGLNKEQLEAVQTTEGPLLILAGAGSGKTRVLTCRAAYLVDRKGVNPWNILAITFTNKAAGEMRERINALVGDGAQSIWVSTFHSTCCRILRRFGDRLGFDRNFHIYDTDDSRQVMKEVLHTLALDPKTFRERAILARISSAKNELEDPDQFAKEADSWFDQKVANCYREYQARLAKNNALDFDDLLMKTVELFEQFPDVLQQYQNRFRYIMIDEYQDTNSAQFRFVQLLASRYRNLCVVGDDDQSIYKFRGANIRNILDFEKVFRDAKVIRLEQNYRSTQNILNAANEVIAHNKGRKKKTLWTENGDGSKIHFREFDNGFEEAEYVAADIRNKMDSGRFKYSDFAVLYRANAMSRLFEEKFIQENIPYKIVGGVNFYARREIKDLLAYLKVIDSAQDDLSAQRIINIPKRGIGAASISKVNVFALANGLSFYEALLHADNVPGLGRAVSKIRQFTDQIEAYKALVSASTTSSDGSTAELADAAGTITSGSAQPETAETLDLRNSGNVEDANTGGAAGKRGFTVRSLLEKIIDDTGYVRALEAEGTDEAQARIENIDEFISKTEAYDEEALHPSLTEFLQQVSLVADIDDVEEGSDYVLLMTLHGAKGLEFDNVYMVGMEEGSFPSFMSIGTGDPDDLEEERRLCYVGITRARKDLTMSAAHWRMIRGESTPMTASRFIQEIPREYVELERETTDTRNFLGGSRNFSAADLLGGSRDISNTYGDGWGSSGRYGTGRGSSGQHGSRNSAGSYATASEDMYSGSRESAFSGGQRSYQKKSAQSGGYDGGTYSGYDSGQKRLGSYGSAAYINPTIGAERPKPKFNAAQFRVKKADHLDFGVGDKVRHVKFGVGTVQEIKDGKKDFEVTVDFENYGVKRMFASFAKLQKVDS